MRIDKELNQLAIMEPELLNSQQFPSLLVSTHIPSVTSELSCVFEYSKNAKVSGICSKDALINGLIKIKK